MHHELKIKDYYYQAIIEKSKNCELRYNDRDYQTGDTISFKIVYSSHTEWVYPDDYDTGKFEITHVLHYPDGLKDWWVVLSLKKI